MKEKKKISFLHAVAVEILILTVICALLFWAETQVTERATEKKLRERAESISESFMTSYRELHGITDRYKEDIQARADSLAFLIDHSDEIDADNIMSLCGVYDVDALYLVDSEEDIPDTVVNTEAYAAETADGRLAVVFKNVEEQEEILAQFEDNNAFRGYSSATSDLYFIFHNKNHYIMVWPEEYGDYVFTKVEDVGIDADELNYEKGKWIRILGERYYAVSVLDEENSLTTVCTVSYSDITKNSRIAVGILFAVIALIFTTLVTFSYFARQEEQHAEGDGAGAYSRDIVKRKMKIYVMTGLALIAMLAYYVQSLYALSLNSLETSEAKINVQSTLESSDSKKEAIEKVYDRQYLAVARIVSHILSRQPELRTQEDLAALSGIFGTDYIMLFDAEGKETVSDSVIFGFEISDDPEAQSYAFNALKYGVQYIIQEAQENELTGEHSKYIGVSMQNREGEYDGFLQVCISPDDLENVLEEVDLENILNSRVSGSENELLAIDKDTGNIICYTKDSSLEGQSVYDLGMTSEQITSNYLGYIRLGDEKLFADSFEAAGYYMYMVISRAVLYSGRPTMTVFTVLVCFFGIGLYTYWFRNKSVRDKVTDPENDPYLEVTTADGTQKKALNIVSRVYHIRVEWDNLTPEEKTLGMIRLVFLLIGMSMAVAYMMRNVLYTEDTIFGFITGNRWNKGFNVFAITNVLIFLSMFILVMSVVGALMDMLVSVSSPKTETVMRLTRSFIKYIGVIGAIYYCLSLFGFDSRSLLASAGIMTLIIGLGAQDLITDILAGLFIIFENEFQVGDIIEVAGFKGRVIEIGIRTTRLVNTKQDVKSVNNRNLTRIVNKTRRNSNCDVLISVGFDQDINAIEAMLKEELPKVAEKCPYIISGPTYGGVDDISGGDMVLSIRAECLESRKFEVRTAINKEIKELFDQYGFKLGG